MSSSPAETLFQSTDSFMVTTNNGCIAFRQSRFAKPRFINALTTLGLVLGLVCTLSHNSGLARLDNSTLAKCGLTKGQDTTNNRYYYCHNRSYHTIHLPKYYFIQQILLTTNNRSYYYWSRSSLRSRPNCLQGPIPEVAAVFDFNC